MRISFHGAAREVTGSCHLLTTNARNRVLFDCGQFQGKSPNKQSNGKPHFDPKGIKEVVLSHAHLDHCGNLPLLVKHGFRGTITSTAPTKELAKICLLDSAKLQEEDARRSTSGSRGKKGKKEPLFTTADVERTINLFTRTIPYKQPVQLYDDTQITLYDAGHILGSAFVECAVLEDEQEKTLIFTGDLGNSNKPLIYDPEIPPHTNFLIEESTYGNRSHKSTEESVTELYDAINRTFERGGNFFIPTFAIERAQDLLYFIWQGLLSGELPSDTKIFLDSPMAIAVTEVFKRHPEFLEEDLSANCANGGGPFSMPNLNCTVTVSESKQINEVKSGAIILAGAGMCTGGRILHHIKNNISNSKNGFGLVSYAPSGTLLANIISIAKGESSRKTLRLFQTDVPVRARIHTIGGLSAHMGQDQLIEFANHASPDSGIALVHGDVPAMTTLAAMLRQQGHKTVTMPELHSSIVV